MTELTKSELAEIEARLGPTETATCAMYEAGIETAIGDINSLLIHIRALEALKRPTHPEAQAVAYVMSFEGEPRIAILRASALEPGTKLYLHPAPDEAVRFPIGGYAPGRYQCKCIDCRMMFYGDKRSVQCLACAQGVTINPFATHNAQEGKGNG